MDRLYIELDGRSGTLMQDFTVRIDHQICDFEVSSITVPQGFKTDFASVPGWLWWLVPPMGKYNRAAVVHDYLYKKNRFSRLAADTIFDHLMRHLYVVRWRRKAMYAGVRAWGWVTWRKYKKSLRKPISISRRLP